MKNHKNPFICVVTDASYDASLVQQIANIERIVQPLDCWDAKTLFGMLSQDIYECWGIMALESSESLKPEECKVAEAYKQADYNGYGAISNENNFSMVAYCLFSKVYEVAEVLRIGTHPDFQRRGYAQQLLILLIDSMTNKGLEKILLEVREDNIKAINLYQKLGFGTIYIRKDYYSSQKDTDSKCNALIMQYELK
ncbi:GNAT family N-acetyltransferase [Psychrobacter sp.]|uniref:GNAT family N-acetyltransferase n=1 Tax=Psychrobacter sp. TaxID=56811 RepID=UPI0025EE3729|nr:GNAT family N-acetyltransferase [Psychrobacter sp.]